jgi:hypothetical protein
VRVEGSPVADVKAVAMIRLHAITEADFPALYALDGQRVRLLAVDAGEVGGS